MDLRCAMAVSVRSTASQVSDLLVEAQQADQSSVFRRQARWVISGDGSWGVMDSHPGLKGLNGQLGYLDANMF